jgi:UDP-glucuronate 4-epimerase
MRNGTVLVTGASGFLAAWIIPKLLASGRRVIATDIRRDSTRLDLATKNQPLSELEWVPLDISDEQACLALADEFKPQDILHLAALMIPACKANPIAGARVNLLGHMHMMEAARAVGARLVYTSSIAAKPRGTANAPANLYGVYKRADEEISRLYAEDYGVASLGLRPNIVYGVGRDLGETAVVTAAARAAALGEAYILPWHTRAGFQFVDDIAEIFHRVVMKDWKGSATSDMSDTTATTEEIVEAILLAAPDARISIDQNERAAPTEGFDISPIVATIGELPQTPIRQGIQNTISHFRELRDLKLV